MNNKINLPLIDSDDFDCKRVAHRVRVFLEMLDDTNVKLTPEKRLELAVQLAHSATIDAWAYAFMHSNALSRFSSKE